jgi:peptide/nickel transport system permease protein
MARFLLKRFALAAITLVVLSMIVFAAAQLLPGDIGRNVLGPFASPADVIKFNHEHGVDRPIVSQYWTWVSHFVQGDLGTSLQYTGVPVANLLGPSLVNSLKLAALAFVLVVPLSILGGTVAALRRNKLTDRVITIAGLSLTSIPEFVTAIVLIVIFGVVLKWLPVSATAPPGAGVIEAIDADYTRTAFLKGLSTRRVLFRHVLRNSLLPTIAVVATQTGYLIGGLLVIEKLFNYNGIGQRIYVAGTNKDFTMLQSGVLIVGMVYLAATLFADLLYSVLNPRIRFGDAD